MSYDYDVGVLLVAMVDVHVTPVVVLVAGKHSWRRAGGCGHCNKFFVDVSVKTLHNRHGMYECLVGSSPCEGR